MEKVQSAFEAIEVLAEADTSIDALKDELNVLFAGYRQQTAILSVGETYYRGVRWDEKPRHTAQLTYPPAPRIARCGRANRVGASMFYGSMARSAVLFECRAQQDDYIAISSWRLQSRMFANSVGFSTKVFHDHQSERDGTLPWEKNSEVHSDPTNKAIHEFFARAFARNVEQGAEEEYKLSTALAEKLLGPIEGGAAVGISDTHVGALIYPALAMRANADNIAFLPEFADRNLELAAVEYVHVEQVVDEMSYKISVQDFANSFGTDGSIDWKSERSRLRATPTDRVVAGVEGNRWVIRDAMGNLLESI